MNMIIIFIFIDQIQNYILDLINEYDYYFYFSGKCEATLKGQHTRVTSCTALPDGRIVSGANNGSVAIWNTQNELTKTIFHKSPQHTKRSFSTRSIKCCIALPIQSFDSFGTRFRLISGSNTTTNVLNIDAKS
jgi:WD40 repeat protein